MKKELEKLQKDYQNRSITKRDLPLNPLQMLEKWLDNAVTYNAPEPNAMIISTVDPSGKPSSRTVLLKEMNSRGLVFYTNYHSRKAKEIENNSLVSILFFWPSMERQVRVEGSTSKISPAESDNYFAGRPRENQIAAWASPQSEKISSRKVLEEKYAEIEKKYVGKEIPRPSYWGGYRISPSYFEFWQGRPGRMNDRIIYQLENDQWKKVRLAP